MKKLGLLVMPLMAISLLASCGQSKPQELEHFVTFESYGGTHIDTQRVKDGETATPPKETPTRGDDTFLGWFTDFEKEYTFTEKVMNDITLYAGWDVAPDPKTSHHFKFTGTDCTMNGSDIYECDIAIEAQTQFAITVDSRHSLPASVEIKKGENVTYEASTGLVKITNMTSDIEINAAGVPIDYFKFDFTGTNCTVNGETHFVQNDIKKGSNLKFTILPNQGYILPESIEIPEAIKSFTGYKDGVISINGITADVTLSVSIGDATIYHFTFNGTDCKMNNSYKVEEDISSSAVTQRSIQVDEGYDLANLNVTITGDGASKVTYSNGIVSINKLNGNVKVTASTSLKQCTVTFDPNGGTRTGSETAKVSYNTKYGDIPNKPTASMTACDFLGWGLTATDTQPVSNDYLIKDTITLYAVFKPIAYTEITFSSESSNCKLIYDGYEYSPSGKFNIPACRETSISITPASGYVQVFRENMIITGTDVTSSFDPAKQVIKVKANVGSNCMIKASTTMLKKNSLDDYSWSEIDQISRNDLAPLLFKVKDTKRLQMPYQDLDSDGEIDSNEVYQTVRIIGFNHDVLTSDSTKTAGITFEFVDLLSDANGYSIVSPMNVEQGTNSDNHDYLNSNLRKAFDGEGDANIYWFEKDGEQQSTTYTTSVLNMLPSNSDPTSPDLKEVLKEVTKPVVVYDENLGDYALNETDYKTKIFPLSFRELAKDRVTAFNIDEGKTYEFYEACTISDPRRIKKQIKGADGAVTKADVIKPFGWSSYNFAGYNDYQLKYGSLYYCRSASEELFDAYLSISTAGDCSQTSISCCYDDFCPLAPAFCI